MNSALLDREQPRLEQLIIDGGPKPDASAPRGGT